MKKKDREKGRNGRRGVDPVRVPLVGAGAVASTSLGKLGAQPAA